MTARYGGEEFVVPLPNTPLDVAKQVAENIRREIRSMEIPHNYSKSGFITLSPDIASLVPEKDQNVKLLINMADQALYNAKAAGRDLLQSASCDSNC